MTVSASLRTAAQAEPAGGEQAANTLQLDGSCRHATTRDAKVRGAIERLPLVTGRPCLRSHSSGHGATRLGSWTLRFLSRWAKPQ